jgi:signal peptidase II
VPTRRDGISLLAIATAVVGLDQLSKSALVAAISAGGDHSRFSFLDGWIAIEYTENRGAAFGLFAGLVPILAAISVAILAGLLFRFLSQACPPYWETVAISLIIGGAVGNLIDRVRLGYVVDFVAIGFWPNFNIADSAITVGVVLLIWGWSRSESMFGAAKPIDQEG